MHRLTRIAVASFTAVLLGACAKEEKPVRETAAAVSPSAISPAMQRALASAAGRWQFGSIQMPGSDTTPMKFVLTATADTTGWTLTFPDKQVVPVKVAFAGDSLHLVSDEFKSPRRKQLTMKTETAFRMQDGKLGGVMNSHYATPGGDSAVQHRIEGMRMP